MRAGCDFDAAALPVFCHWEIYANQKVASTLERKENNASCD